MWPFCIGGKSSNPMLRKIVDLLSVPIVRASLALFVDQQTKGVASSSVIIERKLASYHSHGKSGSRPNL